MGGWSGRVWRVWRADVTCRCAHIAARVGTSGSFNDPRITLPNHPSDRSWPRPQLTTHPLRPQACGTSRLLWRDRIFIRRAGDDGDSFVGDSQRPRCAYEYATDNAGPSNEELHEGGGALMLDESDGLDFELEENARGKTGVLFEGAGVVRYGVLVCV